jgi:hypothetical protein
MTPGTIILRGAAPGAGVPLYFNAWLKSDVTGVSTPAFAASADSTTAADWDGSPVSPAPSAHAVSVHPANGSRGQVVITTLGYYALTPITFAWPQLTAGTLVSALASGTDTADAPTLGRYYDDGGAVECNMRRTQHTGMVGCALNSYAGDTTTDARTIEWINQLTSANNMVHCAARPAAGRESWCATFFVIVRQTPRIWNGLSAAKQAQIDTIVAALLYANAIYLSDTNGSRRTPNLGRTTITGYKGTEGFNSNANLSFGPLAIVCSCAAYFGPTTAASMLETVDFTAFIAQIDSVLGAGSRVGRTWHWLTNTSIPVTGMYRHGPHADAMTVAEMTSRVRGWRFGGNPITDLMNLINHDDLDASNDAMKVGLNRVIPLRIDAKGSNDFIGLTMARPRHDHAYFGASTLTRWIKTPDGAGGTREYGLGASERAALPHQGDTENEYCEESAIDDGTRASHTYTAATRSAAHCVLLSLAIKGLADMNDARFADWMRRFLKAETVCDYRDDAAIMYSIAHISMTTGVPTGYTGGDGFDESIPWANVRGDFRLPVVREIVRAFSRYMRPQAAPVSGFTSAANHGFKRWEKRGGGQALEFDAGETACKLTIDVAGRGIGNITANWTGTEPSPTSANRDDAAGYNSTGHSRLWAGTTYDVAFTAKAGTYGAHALAPVINGTTVTVTEAGGATVLSTSAYRTFTGLYTVGASDIMADIKIIGTGAFTGTVFFKPEAGAVHSITVRPR